MITKLTDDEFNGNHPNGINVGYNRFGEMYDPPTVGDCFYLGSFKTSIVTEIIDKNTFRTENSTYKIEYL